jgi:dipeptidyl aminopeptidase/acylaminoacyl peptidase
MRRIIAQWMFVFLLAGCAAPEPQDVPLTPGATRIVTEPPAATATGILPSTTVVEPEPTFEPTATAGEPLATPEPSPAPELEPLHIAYIGADGNLWLFDPATGEGEPLTQDAASPAPDNPAEAIMYCCAQWTTDRSLLSYRRDAGTPVSGGYDFRYEVWVYDVQNREHRPVIEDQVVAGFAWKPLTHLLAYGLQVEQEYFPLGGGVSSELARGIWAVDADQGEPFELVPPEGDYWLANPEWSRDGRFLSFEEVLHYEGRGNFAYYDSEAQEYIAWDRPIGNYDWSPGGLEIVYDNMLYIPTGTERLFASDRMGEGEREISEPIETGYAFYPIFSPDGDRIAYLAEEGGPESGRYTLFVQSYPEGEPQSLGVFEQVNDLAWLPDGSGLIFSSGSWGSQQVLMVSHPGGEVTTLADGYQPRVPQLLP